MSDKKITEDVASPRAPESVEEALRHQAELSDQHKPVLDAFRQLSTALAAKQWSLNDQSTRDKVASALELSDEEKGRVESAVELARRTGASPGAAILRMRPETISLESSGSAASAEPADMVNERAEASALDDQ